MADLRISLDIDGCICNFYIPYIRKFGIPRRDIEITKNVINKLISDKEFWLSLPVINMPTFKVHQYTTARTIPKCWIKKYLENHGFPKAPIYQLYSHCLSKVPKIKMGGCNLHIDDSLRVFIDCNLHGIPCLLMDNPSNKAYKGIGRIYSLNKEEIECCYNEFIVKEFPYFKEIVYDIK